MKKYILTLTTLLMMAMGPQAMAALSVSVLAGPSPTTINHPVTVNVSITNTGAQVNLSNLKITATSTAAPSSSRLPMAVSVFNIGPNAPVITVPANFTTIVPAGPIVFFSPSTGVTGNGTNTFSIGATVYTSDGSITPATSAGVVTVNPIPLPLSERQ